MKSVNYNSNKMKKINLIAGVGVLIFLFLNSCGNTTSQEQKIENEVSQEIKITIIDFETQEGLDLWKPIVNNTYQKAVDIYGQPSSLYDLGSRFWVNFENLKVKKRGTNFICDLTLIYDNLTLKYSTYRMDNCKLQ